ncbi:MAG TPA: SGNH/GDSL hydrolase family protein [Methylotenera sp.]|nr:SGNH/GDSL hydrolase family protein [Methylotenera sp.]HPH05255.1 SGNH/GDSL hydrolase family protein [Methylotenera sp.]HPN00157.1 SGNH/GDSL hydrolase family protein [Methylotenera sp.]
MKQLLVYADSLSWGIIPLTRNRLRFEQRWPGVLEIGLRAHGKNLRVIEDCLNGRRTMYEDSIKEGRNGLIGLQQRIEINSPLEIVLLMLGTNDFQANHHHNASHAALGLKALIHSIRTAPIEPGMPIPKILVIAPPPIQTPKGEISQKFKDADKKSIGLAKLYEELSSQEGCYFFDAGTVTQSSKIDGVHLDEEQHKALGLALVNYLVNMV